MPIYEYQCRSCGARLEVLQRISDAPLRKCRECSGKLDKLISRTSFQLKGGGWYSQGYSSSGSSGKSGSGKTETKSASKKDKKDKDKAGSSSSASATG